jgi:hypothetical protein
MIEAVTTGSLVLFTDSIIASERDIVDGLNSDDIINRFLLLTYTEFGGPDLDKIIIDVGLRWRICNKMMQNADLKKGNSHVRF